MSGVDSNLHRPICLEDLFAPWHRLGRLEFSPDGQRIVYEYNRALWITDQRGVIERLTDGRTPRWSPASDELAFLRGDPPQVWTRDASGREQQRTSFQRGVSGYAWFPDGRRLAIIRPGEEVEKDRRGKPSLDTIVEIHRLSPLPGDSLWIVTIASGEAHSVASAPRGVNWSQPAVHPGGERVALWEEGYRDEGEHVAVIDCSTGARHRPVQSAVRPCQGPQWSPGGERLAFLYSPHDFIYPLQMQCAVVPVVASESAGKIASYGKGYYIAEGEELCWHPDGQSIFAIGIHGSTRQVLRIELKSGKVRQLTQEPGWYSNLRISRDGDWLACAYVSPTCLGRLCLLPSSGGPPRTLLDVNQPLWDVRLSEVELVHWRARDGWKLEGVLVKPLDYQRGRRYALLVDCHGGPAYGGTAQFNRSWHWLAAQGYLVFSPDFRGGQTYSWVEPEKYPSTTEVDYLDTMSGVDFLIEKGYADPERLGIYGFSYGAELTAWTLGHTHRFRAAVVTCTSADWSIAYGQAQGGGGSALIAGPMGGRPWEVPERYRYYAPITYMHRATTPTLLFTGDVELVHIQMFYTWLRQTGVEVEAIHYRGEGHGFSRPEHRRDWLERMLAWFEKHLKR